MPATGTARPIASLCQSDTAAVAGMARSYGASDVVISNSGQKGLSRSFFASR